MMRIAFEPTDSWHIGVPIEVECSECEERMLLSDIDSHAEEHGADVIGIHIGPDLARHRFEVPWMFQTDRTSSA